MTQERSPVAVVTGGSSGIGFEAFLLLASPKAHKSVTATLKSRSKT
ncbi:MAG: hypothetical protein WBY28_01510 [Nitrososphaeraceae archaeon]